MYSFTRFAPRATAARNSIRSTTPLTIDQLARYTPSVLATEAHSSRGEKYAFIPTIQLLDGLKKEGFELYAAAQSNTRIAGKRDFTKHVLRLRHADFKVPAKVGNVFPEIILTNSHDGASSFQLDSGFFRLECLNGMVSATGAGDSIRVRHTGTVQGDVIDGCTRILDDLQIGIERIQEFQGIQLAQPEAIAFASAALQLRWDEGAAPVQAQQLLSINRSADRSSDLWTVLNRVQESVVRGGLRGRNANNQRVTTRPVTGITEDIKLNKALWSLADSMAALKLSQSTDAFVAQHEASFA